MLPTSQSCDAISPEIQYQLDAILDVARLLSTIRRQNCGRKSRLTSQATSQDTSTLFVDIKSQIVYSAALRSLDVLFLGSSDDGATAQHVAESADHDQRPATAAGFKNAPLGGHFRRDTGGPDRSRRRVLPPAADAVEQADPAQIGFNGPFLRPPDADAASSRILVGLWRLKSRQPRGIECNASATCNSHDSYVDCTGPVNW